MCTVFTQIIIHVCNNVYRKYNHSTNIILSTLRNRDLHITFTIQRQYIFIHDAILEKITCGETEIPSDKFTTELKRLKQPDNNNLENQFEVCHIQPVIMGMHFLLTQKIVFNCISLQLSFHVLINGCAEVRKLHTLCFLLQPV